MPITPTKIEAPRVTLIRTPLNPSRTCQPLACRAGQWLHECLPSDCRPEGWVAVHHGRVLGAGEWKRFLLVPGAEILVYPRLCGTVGKIVSGIIFPPLGVYWALRHAGLPSWASGLLTGGPLGMQFFPSIENIMSGKPSPANVPKTTSDLSSSNTYGFSGITNGTRIGAPIPVVYGDHRVGGQLIGAYVKTEADSDVLHMLFAVSEGQILGMTSIEINEQPIANYTGVSFDLRTGLNAQTTIGLFGDKALTTFDAAAALTTSFITYTTAGSNLNGFELKLVFPGGLFRIDGASGVLLNASVAVEVDYKLSAAGSWTTGPRVTYTDSRRTVMRRTIRVDTLAAGQYDIRVRRTSVESTSNSRVDAVTRETVTEIVNDGYTYPNVALLGVRALATNQLSGGLPRVTGRAFGVQVKIFGPGTSLAYVTSYSDNPAWIVFDMLTNERYGHGRFTWRKLYDTGTIAVTNGSVNFSGTGTSWTASTLRKGAVLHVPSLEALGIVATIDYGTQSGTFEAVWPSATQSGLAYEVRANDLDIMSFIDWANFCNESVPNGKGGTEKRATCDFVFDADQENIWSAVLRICGIGQASAVKIGTYIRIKIEQASEPVQLFTMANIKENTFEEIFLPLKDRANIFEVQFLNRENNFAQDLAVLEDPLLITNADQPRRKTITGYGITRSSHAGRLARFSQRANRYVTRTISFEAALDAVTCEPGDVIRFQHDIPQWGFGGRALTGSTSSTIVLDREETIEAATSYEVLVRHADDTVETGIVTTSPGTVSTLTISGTWAQNPAKGDIWAFGETTISTKPFRIISIERTQELDVRVTAVEYSAAVYEDSDIGGVNQINYSALADLTGPPGNVLDLTMLEQNDATQSIWVSWSPPGSPNFKAGRVYRVGDRLPTLLGESTNGSFPISDVPSGELVRVQVTSVSTAGVESSLAMAPTAEIIRSSIYPPDVQTVVLEGDRLRWQYPAPPRDLAGFLVRFRPGTSRSWESATPAHANVILTTDFQIFQRSGIQTFLVKAVDLAGNESLTATALTVSFDAAETANIVLTTDHRALGWPGTITNGSIVSGDLEANASAVFWTSDLVLMWSASETADMWTDVYDELTYELLVQPSADVLDTAITLQLTMAGEWSIDYLADSSEPMWAADDTELMWDEDDSAVAWMSPGDYIQWPGQLDHLREQQYRIRITGYAGNVQAVIEQLSIVLDVADIFERFEDVPIAAPGTRLILSETYRAIRSVRLVLQADGGTAAYAKLMDKNATLGPLIKTFDSSDVAVTGLVDAVVHGY